MKIETTTRDDLVGPEPLRIAHYVIKKKSNPLIFNNKVFKQWQDA